MLPYFAQLLAFCIRTLYTHTSTATNSPRPITCLRLVALGPVDLSSRTLSGRLEYTARRHKFSKGSLSLPCFARSPEKLKARLVSPDESLHPALSHHAAKVLGMVCSSSWCLTHTLNPCSAQLLASCIRALYTHPICTYRKRRRSGLTKVGPSAHSTR